MGHFAREREESVLRPVLSLIPGVGCLALLWLLTCLCLRASLWLLMCLCLRASLLDGTCGRCRVGRGRPRGSLSSGSLIYIAGMCGARGRMAGLRRPLDVGVSRRIGRGANV
jgi:hypothetical protein